ncbi:Crp/Fnr family transcriptional regulator [Listeria booriae]|uniref:Crp/Fnr family transcriptional regulator n=1 Tax=Listeria booriae TaxID=1552123 RepID=UPI00162AAC05|nr:Crp/Fnr family transcriptional regulator [Listeria booriae]MBC1558416.1 Crp/Fnr family transcriptional regulator [Listeria booriae]MBC1911885.1 Crp/Fnr family transcriptional regulator [Listeria booriae]MBC2207859.1 Crp/Fnr family transcriptional regulator [Listeria booriae]
MLSELHGLNREHFKKNKKIFNHFFKEYPEEIQKITLKKGEYLVQENERYKGVFFINKGIAIKEVLLKNGKAQGFRLTNEFEFIGTTALTGLFRSPYDIRSLTDMECYKLSDTLLNQIISEYPTYLYEGIQVDSYINYQRMKFHTGKVEERIIYNIIELAEHFGEKINNNVLLPNIITQELLAILSSTTREYVARIIAALKSVQILDTKKRNIIINDIGKLGNLIY